MKDLRVSFPNPCTENWDAMAPIGCDRHCASCDKIIFDLKQFTIIEAERLLDSGEEICVRAHVDAQGKVALKSEPWRKARRMVATVGAGVGLFAGGPGLAASRQPEGVIVGKVENVDWGTRVTTTGTDGRTYQAKVKNNGNYKIKHVPPGQYSLRFTPTCSDPWDAGNAVVVAGESTLKNTADPGGCIVVGLLKVENDHG